MIQACYRWLADIAGFMIFMTVVLHILPNTGGRKLVRFFLGLVFILVVLQPVTTLLGKEGLLSDICSYTGIWQESRQLPDSLFRVEGLQEQYLQQAYEKELGAQIREYLEAQQLVVHTVEVPLQMKERQASSGQQLPEQTQTAAQSVGQFEITAIRATVSDTKQGLYQSTDASQEEDRFQKQESISTRLASIYQLAVSSISIVWE